MFSKINKNFSGKFGLEINNRPIQGNTIYVHRLYIVHRQSTKYVFFVLASMRLCRRSTYKEALDKNIITKA